MATVWKINGTECGPGHGLRDVQLELGNQVADVLSFTQDGAAFDGSALFAFGDTITLTRTVDSDPAVTWFRGRIVSVPRTGLARGESLTYQAKGGWAELEQFAFMQLYKEAITVSDPASSLTSILRGRVVLGQDDAGAKVSLQQAIIDIIDFAIASGAALQRGSVSLSGTIPWDEVTDMSCADAIQRLLQFAPAAVVWVDHSTTPPTINCARRASLTAVNLALDAGTIEAVELTPRYDLKCDHVCLIYVATNRANEASWETTTRDVYPGGTTGRERNALVRTIRLAGSVLDQTILEQKIQTAEFNPAKLAFGDGPIVNSGGTAADFSTLRTFWRRHHPALQSGAVEIKSFRAGTFGPQDPDEELDTLCIRELTSGAVTDWMQDFQGVHSQQVAATADIEVEVTDPSDATRKERLVIKASAVFTATNASRTLYTFLQDSSFTPAEEIPTDLAYAIYTDVNQLHWDGRVSLVEAEPTLAITPGKKLNLTGSLTAWSTMAALVQSARVSIDDGRTEIRVGPPAQIGVDQLVEVYRSNRARQPVTSYMVRTGGKTGAASQKQSLSKHHPVKGGTPQLPLPGRVFVTTVP